MCWSILALVVSCRSERKAVDGFLGLIGIAYSLPVRETLALLVFFAGGACARGDFMTSRQPDAR